ncbi:MAG TPA: rhodanese-like domain-containing protein [Candidatus Izemoplasmatales bacterium]|nr:rhodanese-like domain-containing protein [Candidatus Izemoplasmatales bacterium]
MRKWMKWTMTIFAGTLLAACQPRPVAEKISASKGKTMMEENEDVILVDVRTLEEFAAGHIEGAILLPLASISAQASTVIPDKKAIYIIYCRSGNRSAQAVDLLVEMGYETLYDMGGIIDWPYGTVTD